MRSDALTMSTEEGKTVYQEKLKVRDYRSCYEIVMYMKFLKEDKDVETEVYMAEPQKRDDPLKWWKMNGHHFPHL